MIVLESILNKKVTNLFKHGITFIYDDDNEKTISCCFRINLLP